MGRRGAAAAEFVLVLWILTLLLLFTIELGIAANVQLLVTGAAREGARRAAVDGGDTPSARQAILRYLTPAGLTAEGVAIEIKPAHASYGTSVQVRVAVEHTWRTPVVRRLLGPAATIRAEAVTRSEKVRTGT